MTHHDLLKIDDCFALLDRLALKSDEPDELAKRLRTHFKRAAKVRTKPIDHSRFFLALGRVVHDAGVGIWLDHKEVQLFQDQCRFAFNGPWVLKDAGQHEVFTYRRRTLDVASFEAFDDWLREYNERELASGTWPTSALVSQPLRLVVINTGSDFWLAVLHPAHLIDELLSWLESLGMSAWRPLSKVAKGEVISVDNCLQVVDQLAQMQRPFLRVEAAERMRKTFRKLVKGQPELIERSTFLWVLLETARTHGVGWIRDIGEAAHFFEEDCYQLSSDRAMETPENSKGDHPRFRYKRKTVDDDSFAAFDGWLGQQQLRTRAKRVKAQNGVVVNGEMIRNRIVGIDPEIGAWAAIAHPASEIPKLIEMLDRYGIRAWRALEDSADEVDVWSIPAGVTIDIASTHLMQQHEFELVELENSTTHMRCWVDNQHAVTASLSIRQGTVSVAFGLDRKDIRELLAQIVTGPGGFKDKYPLVYETRRETNRYPVRPVEGWGEFCNAADVIGYLDRWVPEYKALANFGHIQHHLENIGRHGWPLIGNRMLDGWQPEADDALFKKLLKSFQVIPGQAEARIENAKQWIVNNPDGLNRTLTD